ncbi:hypothetical protein CC85DRAFT_241547 [Cutaneotrichosporon oleaginosum]|uniref:glucan 1,4-alpha-glucosidase n=1 Tax=Cutaneotrichosporon oleaginosum TaxID=879819 RepID=A0A0J0XVK8_9TREE|nr:uncharacterized protein CC85DRAFT_241547 [Cutaneotrichosporon oleaginosum]KLT45107.1 hypothetical protein CC85DRAFT_241547 [Cutaneotrichosporon oleaginosum]TXT09788.1 hypothetical protein COLE_03722 [Cutaneotrichosporon oleaginosum]
MLLGAALPWPLPHLRAIRKTHAALPHHPSAPKLDKWILAEADFAYKRILDNIGPAAGVRDGVVIASPSKGDNSSEPDYFYTWTRDAALTITSLLPSFLPESYLSPWHSVWSTDAPLQRSHTNSDPLLEGLVRSYISFQAKLQRIPNPSGDLWTGGLAEPKFTVSGAPYMGAWGRPQRDGPALRALALIPYAHWLLDRGHSSDLAYVRRALYDSHAIRQPGIVLKNDLEEVANSWHRPSFDLWEEVQTRHLWTDAVARRALQAGARLATRLGDHGASGFYAAQAAKLGEHMQSYYHASKGWRAFDNPGRRTGLDAAILLASLHAGGGNATEDLAPGTMLSSLRQYVLSFAGLYETNSGNWTDGWLVGRYAEDVYDGVGFSGGNPWYITTFAVATTLYRAQRDFAEAGKIDLDDNNAAFWSDVLGPAGHFVQWEAGRWSAGTAGFERAMTALGRVADAFVIKAARTMRGGRMSEQIRGGKGRGARDLTWSYASFLEVKRARDAAKAAWGRAREEARREREALRRPRQ